MAEKFSPTFRLSAFNKDTLEGQHEGTLVNDTAGVRAVLAADLAPLIDCALARYRFRVIPFFVGTRSLESFFSVHVRILTKSCPRYSLISTRISSNEFIENSGFEPGLKLSHVVWLGGKKGRHRRPD